MGQKIGIYVISDKNWGHLLGIAKAAVYKGMELIIFFSYRGVLLTKRPDFVELAGVVNEHGKMSLCLHSWNQHKLGDDHKMHGIAETDFATQVRHAELIEEMDRYLVL